MKCEFCGKDEALPFVCNYCGSVFCGEHRLPENHQCRGDLTQRRTVVPPPQTTFTWSGSTYYPQPRQGQGNAFSLTEVRDIAVAYLGLVLAFTISASGGFQSQLLSNPFQYGDALAVSFLAVGPGFVLHELSHKFAARRYGHWAEFRMWPLGLLFALATSLLGIIFAAPGATYISGMNISPEQNGKISLAGPSTNIIVALAFSSLILSSNGFLHGLGLYGAYINVFLAMFNLLPIMPLDGAKVFGWNKLIWVAFFAPLFLAFLTFLPYLR